MEDRETPRYPGIYIEVTDKDFRGVKLTMSTYLTSANVDGIRDGMTTVHELLKEVFCGR